MQKNKICPLCGKTYTAPPSLSRRDNSTSICPDCGIVEALEAVGIDRNSGTAVSILAQIRGFREAEARRVTTPQKRTEAAVRATGNRWAMENFRATHD